MSLIDRDLAIRAVAEDLRDAAITERPDCTITVEDWLPIVERILSRVPDAEPLDVQTAYIKGKIDGIKECTEKLHKARMDVAERWKDEGSD